MKGWKKRSQKYVLRTRWLSLRKDGYKTPEGKIVDDFYIVERPDFVVIVPETKDGKFVLVKQYRLGIEKNILNFPMGFTEKGEPIRRTARRELIEETGFSGGTITHIGSFLLSPPFIKSTGHVFSIRNISKKRGKGIDDKGEIEKVMIVSGRELEKLIKKKKLPDFVSIGSYLLLKNSRSG